VSVEVVAVVVVELPGEGVGVLPGGGKVVQEKVCPATTAQLVDEVDFLVVVVLDVASTAWVLSPGDADEVGSVTAWVVAGLSRSATNPARRTVAAMAPRRAALIGRTAAAEGV
jgi:hypothetical protein